jgi:hypothetical protein
MCVAVFFTFGSSVYALTQPSHFKREFFCWIRFFVFSGSSQHPEQNKWTTSQSSHSSPQFDEADSIQAVRQRSGAHALPDFEFYDRFADSPVECVRLVKKTGITAVISCLDNFVKRL